MTDKDINMQTDQVLYNDYQALAQLKKGAREQSPEAIKKVAQQFEALFVQMMLKSMRDTVPENELFGSQAEQTYQEMYDKQLSKQISTGRGIGLAETIERQLGGVPENNLSDKSIDQYLFGPNITNKISKVSGNRQLALVKSHTPENKILSVKKSSDKNVETLQVDVKEKIEWNTAEKFVQDIWPHAERVAKKLGINPDILVAQSVLETGWGKHMPKNSDGSSSFNLFGIKADQRWPGDKVEITTREVRYGVVQQEKAAFRSYESVSQAFDDYADFIMDSPRYQKALKADDNGKSYAHELQKAGYATDPDYAKKINRLRGNDLVKGQQINVYDSKTD